MTPTIKQKVKKITNKKELPNIYAHPSTLTTKQKAYSGYLKAIRKVKTVTHRIPEVFLKLNSAYMPDPDYKLALHFATQSIMYYSEAIGKMANELKNKAKQNVVYDKMFDLTVKLVKKYRTNMIFGKAYIKYSKIVERNTNNIEKINNLLKKANFNTTIKYQNHNNIEGFIAMDSVSFKKVIDNLMYNALDRVTKFQNMQQISKGYIDIETRANKKEITITVKDNGVDMITPKLLNSLRFEITNKILNHYEGKIDFDRKKGLNVIKVIYPI